jgi:3-hydroxybutyryl-CoA dehydrogenase
MKIAAVGNEWSVKALASRKFNPGIEWVWVEGVDALGQHRDAVLYADLDFIPDADRIRKLSLLRPIPVLIHSVVHTLAEIDALAEDDRPGISSGSATASFIRINGWPGLLERTPCELAVRDKEDEAFAGKLFDWLGWPCRLAPDIPGMISGRILAAIINEAWFTLQDGVSTKEEIDIAMRLGTNYPAGPFEWGQLIGLGAIYELLVKMSETDNRYCPAGVLAEELRKVKI